MIGSFWQTCSYCSCVYLWLIKRSNILFYFILFYKQAFLFLSLQRVKRPLSPGRVKHGTVRHTHTRALDMEFIQNVIMLCPEAAEEDQHRVSDHYLPQAGAPLLLLCFHHSETLQPATTAACQPSHGKVRPDHIHTCADARFNKQL